MSANGRKLVSLYSQSRAPRCRLTIVSASATSRGRGSPLRIRTDPILPSSNGSFLKRQRRQSEVDWKAAGRFEKQNSAATRKLPRFRDAAAICGLVVLFPLVRASEAVFRDLPAL